VSEKKRRSDLGVLPVPDSGEFDEEDRRSILGVMITGEDPPPPPPPAPEIGEPDIYAGKYLLVEINFRKKNPGSIATYYFSDRFAPAGVLYSGSPEYLPVITAISSLGSEMGETLPKNKQASITFTNAKGTLRYDQSVADLLSDYSVIDQEIRVYTFNRGQMPGSSSDTVSEFTGLVRDVSISNTADTVTFSIYESVMGSDNFNAIIDNQSFPTADDRAKGRIVPVLIGREVEAVALNIAKSTNFYRYGYATAIDSPRIRSEGATKILAKTGRGDFGEVRTEPDALFNAFGNFPQPPDVFGADYIDIWERAEIAQKINTQEGRLITGVRGFFALGLTGTYPADYEDGSIFFKVYESESSVSVSGGENDIPADSLMRASVEVDQTSGEFFATVASRNVYIFNLAFDKAVPVVPGRDYFIAFGNVQNDATEVLLPVRSNRSADNVPLWAKGQYQDLLPEAGNTWIKLSGDRNVYRWQIMAAKIADVPNPTVFNAATNRGISYFDLTVNTAGGVSGGNQVTTSFERNEFIVVADGLRDTSTGTITGTNNKLIESGLDVSKLLTALSGSTKTVSTTGFTNIQDRNLSGSFNSLTSLRESLSEALFNSSARLLPRRNGNYRYYKYGSRWAALPKIITEADAQLLSLNIGDRGQIVNLGSVFFNKLAQPLELEDVQEGAQNYQGGLVLSAGSPSIDIYGRRQLSDSGTFLNFLKNSSQASQFLDAIFKQYAMESWIVEFRLPYWANDYKEIELGSIVRFKHQKNPHFPGSDSPVTAQKPLPNNSFNFGQVWMRAKTYPLRILSREVEYLVGSGEPTIKFKAKVLNNKEEIY
jgi:hypothetical protein